MINLELFKDDTESFLRLNEAEFLTLKQEILYQLDPDRHRANDRRARDELHEELAVMLCMYIVAELEGFDIENPPENPLDEYTNAVNIILVQLVLDSLVEVGVMNKDGTLNVKLPPKSD